MRRAVALASAPAIVVSSGGRSRPANADSRKRPRVGGSTGRLRDLGTVS